MQLGKGAVRKIRRDLHPEVPEILPSVRGDEDEKRHEILHPDSCLGHRDLLLLVSLKRSEDKLS